MVGLASLTSSRAARPTLQYLYLTQATLANLVTRWLGFWLDKRGRDVFFRHGKIQASTRIAYKQG